MSDIKFEIVEKIDVLSASTTGWLTELDSID